MVEKNRIDGAITVGLVDVGDFVKLLHAEPTTRAPRPDASAAAR